MIIPHSRQVNVRRDRGLAQRISMLDGMSKKRSQTSVGMIARRLRTEDNEGNEDDDADKTEPVPDAEAKSLIGSRYTDDTDICLVDLTEGEEGCANRDQTPVHLPPNHNMGKYSR